jgi:hypothetical protein
MTMPVIAPWWGDVITTASVNPIPGFIIAVPNNVYYRLSTTPSVADTVRMAADVAQVFPDEPVFTPQVVLAVTWFAVAPYNTANNFDTLQAVIAWDSSRSFVTL